MTRKTSAIIYKPESQYNWYSKASNPILTDIIRDDLILIQGRVSYEGRGWYDFSAHLFCRQQECYEYTVRTKKKKFRVISPVNKTIAEKYRDHKVANNRKIIDESVMTFLIEPGKYKSEERKKANYIIDVSENKPSKEKNKAVAYIKGNAERFGYLVMNAVLWMGVKVAYASAPLSIVLTAPIAMPISLFTLPHNIIPLFRKRYYLDE